MASFKLGASRARWLHFWDEFGVSANVTAPGILGVQVYKQYLLVGLKYVIK